MRQDFQREHGASAFGADMLDQFRLGPSNGRNIAEPFRVRIANRGDNGEIGIGEITQALDRTDAIGAHFGDEKFMPAL